jgi:sulfite reductase (ferredoxin)
MSPGIKATHPRLAEPLGSVGLDQLQTAVKTIIAIHRDYGNRANRKLARLKYVIEEWGLDRFRAEFESRLGAPLSPPEPLPWECASDHLGWHAQADGSFFLGLPIPSGRIRDGIRTGLRELIERFRPAVRLTTQQNLLLAGITAGERAEVSRVAGAHGIRLSEELPPVVREALACVALPTCGLAVTEAERVLPELLAELHRAMAEIGIGGEPISVRITGCPNGCARPYTAEIGIVGRSVDLYEIYLSASHLGMRLGSVFAGNVPRRDIVQRLRPALALYAGERRPQESFGDFCHRVGFEALRAQEAAVA